MSDEISKEDQDSARQHEQARRVREMFADIASRYDLLNHLLSGNIDKQWRRLVAKALYQGLPNEGSRILDVACGTGDLSLTLTGSGDAQVIAIDFCRPMLDIAASKSSKRGSEIRFIEGDALALPFRDRIFEAATIAFGLRNLASVETGLSELLRVLKPGGKVAVLEFSKPRWAVFRSFFKVYFTKVLPLVGGLVSGSRGAYQYLPDSVSRFPNQKELSSMMRKAGFEEITYQNLTGGIAALHIGKRPR